MSNATNKDGIPIRVGQVWRSGAKAYIITGGCIDMVWVTNYHDRCENIIYQKSTKEFPALAVLVDCPVWGDMSDWRIVTDEEKAKHEKPKCAEWYSPGFNEWLGRVGEEYEHNSNGWIIGLDYRIPRDHEWDTPQEQEPPKREPIECLELRM